jgi:hypothetical protein
MAIKAPAGGVTGEDFTAALEALRVSVAEVAKATGIPRTYLSDLRNHGTPLRREYAAKLRDWLIGEGVEFEDDADDPPEIKGKGARVAVPHPTLSHAAACVFAVLPSRAAGTVGKMIDNMHDVQERIRTLAAQESDEDAIRELFALCAWNYMQFCYLTGFGDFGNAEGTVGAVLFEVVNDDAARVGIEPADFEAEPETEGA